MKKIVYRREAGAEEDARERKAYIIVGALVSVVSALLFVFVLPTLVMGIAAFGHYVGAPIPAIGYWAAVFWTTMAGLLFGLIGWIRS